MRDGELGHELDEVVVGELVEPLGVEADFGFFAVEDLEDLVLVGLGVGGDFFAGEGLAGDVFAGGVADEGGAVADEEDDGVAELLEVLELAHEHGVAEVEVGGGGVEAGLDAEGDARLAGVFEAGGEGVGRGGCGGRDDFGGAFGDEVELVGYGGEGVFGFGWHRVELKYRSCAVGWCALGGGWAGDILTRMDVERARRFLLGLPHVVETMQWGDHLVFWAGDKAIGGKMFCLINLDAGAHGVVSYSAGAERFAELVELEGVVPAPYMARIYWVAVERWDVLRNSEWERELRAAHAITLGKLPKGVRAVLELPERELGKVVAERRKVLAKRAEAKVGGKKKRGG